MASKVAAPAIGRALTRSSAKSVLQSPSGSNAAPLGKRKRDSATSSSKAAPPPSSSKAAPPSSSSQAAKASGGNAKTKPVISAKAAGGNAVSPIQPRKLDANKSKAPAGSSDAASTRIRKVVISEANNSALFTMLALKVPNMTRFRERWAAIGPSLTGKSIYTHYDANSFVSDAVHAFSSDKEPMDRSTAAQLFNTLVDYLREDPSFSYEKRLSWVRAHCEFTGEELPHPYDDATRDHYAREAEEERQAKRRRTNANGTPIPAATDRAVIVDDDEESESAVGDELDAFSILKKSALLNATTVWGEAAGFSIVPHETILAMHRRTAQSAAAADVNSTKAATIIWPELKRWNKDAWHIFDKAWWNCVVRAVRSGVYSTMISLIDLDIINDIQIDLGIKPENWFDTTEVDFIRKAHGHWGPKNKEEALELLKTVSCRVYSGNIDPSTFLDVLSKYNISFLNLLDLQIAPSIRKWPAFGKPKFGPLTLKSIRKAFKDGFASSKDTSSSCKHCYDVIDQNPDLSHKDLYTELRVHFQEDAIALSRSTMSGGRASAGKKSFNDRQAGGGRREDQSPNGGRRDQSANGGRRDRDDRSPRTDRTRKEPRQASGTNFKVVAGKDRCQCCGDYTNHYGKGIKLCPVVGHALAKPKGYVWKDSDKEPKVDIPNKEYQELKKTKASIFEANARNRVDYRATKVSKQEQYFSSAHVARVDAADFISDNGEGVQSDSNSFVTHNGSQYNGAPPMQPVCMDVIQLGERFAPSDNLLSLEDMGYSERFFGVAKFFTNVKVQSPPTASSSQQSLYLSRNVQKGKYKRSPRRVFICVSETSPTNLISASSIANTSANGKLRILGERQSDDLKLDPRPQVLLECCVQPAEDVDAKRFQEWFTIDSSNSVLFNNVVITSLCASRHGLIATSAAVDLANDDGTPPAVVGRVFFDTGAQMSCIAPHLVAEALCINKATVNVKVMQGVHDAGNVSEAVQLSFDLFDNEMKPTRHSEWFLVWDNPYGIILGDAFCDQFTSWKQILASWTGQQAKAMFNLPSTFTSWTKVSEDQSSATNAINETNQRKKPRADTSQLVSSHPVTGAPLKHRSAGSRPIVGSNDHKNYVPFDGTRPAGMLHESARRVDRYLDSKFKEKRLKSILQALPREDRVSFDIAEMQNRFAADQSSICLQIMQDCVGLPTGLMMGCGAGGIVRRSSMFEPTVRINAQETAVTPEVAAQTAAERYLLAKAAAPVWLWTDKDEQHYQQLRTAPQPPATVITSVPLTEIQKFTVNWMTAATARARDTGRSVAWTREQDQVVRDMKQRAAATSKATPLATAAVATTPISAEHVFKPGDIVCFNNCTRLPEFNGKLGRLYEICADTDDKWKIRVLGRDHGQFVTSTPRNFIINVEQKRFVSASQANYHDIGIDDGGMPIESVEDTPKPVHRQFGKEYSAELTRRIKEVLARFPDLFDGDISVACDFEEMDIKLKPNAILPSKARYYRNTPLMREEVRRQIQEQLDAGIISRAPTAVVSNVLMVKRPHMPGRYRFVVDYRAVNEATVPDVLLMPDVKSQHDRLANKKIFGCVDISSYYRLIKLKKSCRYLTGFATEDGTYVYNRVPMGVRNACSHAQRVLQDKLADDPVLGIQGANIRNYFDDIAWGSNSEDEFIAVLTALMEFGAAHGLKYNIDKSCFGVDSITHVGFVADKDGIRIDPERTRDIVEMQSPKSTTKVQSILGTLNFVRNFIPNFSIKAKFLTDRLEKSAVKRDAGKKFTWDASDEVAFAELKSLVVAAPLLCILDYTKAIYIRCDSSRFGAGAVLFQYDADGREMPVCYASRKYTATETRYSTFQQEMGCVVWALERFQEYTLGYKVIVETDHRNISFVKRSVMPQLARWRMRLEAFDFDIHYRCGALQQVADGLSRSACDEDGIDAVAIHYRDVLPECSLANAAPAAALQFINVDAVNFFENVSDAAASDVCYQDDSGIANDWDNCVSADPVDVDAAADGPADDIDDIDAVPPLPWNNAAAIKSIIESVHNDVAGHGGVLVTMQRLLRIGTPVVSRKQMLRDIDDYLRGCVGCQKMRKRSTGSAVTRRVISGSPFSDLSVDILKLPFPDAYGNIYIVVIVDNFSHWVSTYACANKSALCAARALVHHIGTFGVPLRIRSDGGGEFCNDVVRQLSHMIDFKQIVVQPYLHTANGIVERVNRSILERLRFILFDRRIRKQPKLQWTDLLPLAQRIVNTSTHSAIGTSPARLIFGDHIDLDRCIISKPPKPIRNKPIPEYVEQLSAMQLAMMEAANDHQISVQRKVIAKSERDNRGKPSKLLAVGDLVLVKPLSDFPHDKLAPSQLGPMYVREISAGGQVHVEHPHSNKMSVVSDFQCELFDNSIASTVEGLKAVAETDGFEFAVDGILAHGLLTGDDDVEPTQLPASHVRRQPAKNYGFLIKWTGYETPTWIAYKAARRLPHFDNYVGQFPNLKMDQHS
jgi:hypothetical protein